MKTQNFILRTLAVGPLNTHPTTVWPSQHFDFAALLASLPKSYGAPCADSIRPVITVQPPLSSRPLDRPEEWPTSRWFQRLVKIQPARQVSLVVRLIGINIRDEVVDHMPPTSPSRDLTTVANTALTFEQSRQVPSHRDGSCKGSCGPSDKSSSKSSNGHSSTPSSSTSIPTRLSEQASLPAIAGMRHKYFI